MNVTQTTDGGVWQTTPLSLDVRSDREIWTIVYEGEYDALLTMSAGYFVGQRYDFPPSTNSYFQDVAVIAAVRLSRKVGGLGTLALSYSVLYKLEIWNIDFSEISKDIKCWLILQFTDSNGNVADEAYDQLNLLLRWERQANKSWELYRRFEWQRGSVLPDVAKRVAQKILKGVRNYPWYAPVITRTTVHPFSPPVGAIGRRQNPSSVSANGWSGFNGEGLPSSWLGLAREFLKTAEKSNCNGDGTFTLVEQWLGADELDPDLYPSA